jgi:cell wall-associated NlpC family hydrolase
MGKKEKKQRQMVVAEAKSWIGTPFHWHARLKGIGIDCGTFLIEVWERCGLMEHFEPPFYSVDFNLHRSEEWYKAIIEQYCVLVEGRDPLPGDIVLYKFGRCFSHGTIVCDWPHIISADIQRGVILASAAKERFLNHERLIYSFWR